MNSQIYFESIMKNLELEQVKFLKNKTIFITGATGLIGSYFTDALMCANEKFNLNINVLILSRNKERILERFNNHINKENFRYIIQDVVEKFDIDENIDYIIHAASNANPKLYSTEPIGTMLDNIYGMQNILELAKEKNSKVVYLSSSEAYGKIDTNSTSYDEKTGGYIDTTDARSCYPIAKLASETLAACYKQQYNIDFYIMRICHVYGPTMLKNDNRAVSAFILNGVNNQDITLKSSGQAKRCYCYVGDLFDATILVLKSGTSGEIYNFSSELNLISIKELAKIIANHSNIEVKFDLNAKEEGINKNQFIFMSSKKIENLGFNCKYNVEDGINLTIDILKEKKKVRRR